IVDVPIARANRRSVEPQPAPKYSLTGTNGDIEVCVPGLHFDHHHWGIWARVLRLCMHDERTEQGWDQETPHHRGLLSSKKVVDAKSRPWNVAPITVAVSADRASRRPASEKRDARYQHRAGNRIRADAVPGE